MYVIDPLVNLCVNLSCINVRQHEEEDIAIKSITSESKGYS